MTRAEDHRLVQILGGEEMVRVMIAKSELSPVEPPKFSDWTRGHTQGLLTKLGGEEIARKIATGELTCKIMDGVAVVEVATNPFFDHTGRGIPFKGMGGFVDENRVFHHDQFQVEYRGRYVRAKEYFGRGCKFMSVGEFEARCNAVLEFVHQSTRIGNLLARPYFPWVMPQLDGDLSQMLDGVLVPAMERAYRAQFPNRGFTNHRHGELARQVTVVTETRQERLIDAMAKGSVCGVYFPALQGFGIPADREFIKRIPETRLILSGVEVPAVVTAYPDVCGSNYNTPGLDMAALQWQSSAYSLCFRAGDGGARFVRRNLLADGDYAGGVSVLG
ncbi:MAG: hypothetical protein ABIJ23_02850 [Candidatus Magasanikbacteria bacterium]